MRPAKVLLLCALLIAACSDSGGSSATDGGLNGDAGGSSDGGGTTTTPDAGPGDAGDAGTEPTTYEVLVEGVSDVDVHGGFAYYVAETAPGAGATAIMKLAEAGGSPVMLSSTQEFAGSLLADDTHVYWRDSAGTAATTRIVRVPVAGGDAEVLGTDFRNPQRLAFDGLGFLYFTTTDGIVRLPMDGSASPEYVTTGFVPTYMVVNSTHVYWAEVSGGTYYVSRRTLDGATSDNNLITVPFLRGFALDGTHLYWADSDSFGANLTISRAPLAGPFTTSETLVSGGNAPVGYEIALDSTHVYWSEGNIRRVPVSGGAAQTVLVQSDANKTPAELAVGASHVYFIEEEKDPGTGLVSARRLARAPKDP